MSRKTSHFPRTRRVLLLALAISLISVSAAYAGLGGGPGTGQTGGYNGSGGGVHCVAGRLWGPSRPVSTNSSLEGQLNGSSGTPIFKDLWWPCIYPMVNNNDSGGVPYRIVPSGFDVWRFYATSEFNTTTHKFTPTGVYLTTYSRLNLPLLGAQCNPFIPACYQFFAPTPADRGVNASLGTEWTNTFAAGFGVNDRVNDVTQTGREVWFTDASQMLTSGQVVRKLGAQSCTARNTQTIEADLANPALRPTMQKMLGSFFWNLALPSTRNALAPNGNQEMARVFTGLPESVIRDPLFQSGNPARGKNANPNYWKNVVYGSIDGKGTDIPCSSEYSNVVAAAPGQVVVPYNYEVTCWMPTSDHARTYQVQTPSGVSDADTATRYGGRRYYPRDDYGIPQADSDPLIAAVRPSLANEVLTREQTPAGQAGLQGYWQSGDSGHTPRVRALEPGSAGWIDPPAGTALVAKTFAHCYRPTANAPLVKTGTTNVVSPDPLRLNVDVNSPSVLQTGGSLIPTDQRDFSTNAGQPTLLECKSGTGTPPTKNTSCTTKSPDGTSATTKLLSVTVKIQLASSGSPTYVGGAGMTSGDPRVYDYVYTTTTGTNAANPVAKALGEFYRATGTNQRVAVVVSATAVAQVETIAGSSIQVCKPPDFKICTTPPNGNNAATPQYRNVTVPTYRYTFVLGGVRTPARPPVGPNVQVSAKLQVIGARNS